MTERPVAHEHFSGRELLAALEDLWKGKLHLSLSDEAAALLTSISAEQAREFIQELAVKQNRNDTGLAFPQNQKLVVNLYNLLVRYSLHPERVQVREHLFSCPCCRNFVLKSLQDFFAKVLTSDQSGEDVGRVIVDDLPYILMSSEFLTNGELKEIGTRGHIEGVAQQVIRKAAQRMHSQLASVGEKITQDQFVSDFMTNFQDVILAANIAAEAGKGNPIDIKLLDLLPPAMRVEGALLQLKIHLALSK